MAEPRRSPWSWHLGSIARIPIRVHITLVLLLAWIAVAYSLRGVSPSATVAGVTLVVIVFAIVLLHELAHALMARRFGVGTKQILLLPIGGIAHIERIPERPTQELAIALIGPALNIVLAIGIWALRGGDVELDAAGSLPALVAVQLFWINLALAAFNLVPAFPLDGGRAFRALLSIWVRRDTATRVAAGLGKLVALALGIYGLLYNPWLAVIALVIWLGARREVDAMEVRSALGGVPASAAMLRNIDVVDAHESLATAAAKVITSGGGALSIVEHGLPIGVLTERDLAVGIDRVGPTTPVARAPHHDLVTVEANEPLERVLDRLEEDPDNVVVVVDQGSPIGVITPEQLARYAAFRSNRPSGMRGAQ